VALNPVIKFTTLFGLLAVELAVSIGDPAGRFGLNGPMITHVLAALFFLASTYFVWRSFHKMRIGELAGDAVALNPQPEPPGVIRPGDSVSLNPQPLPPRSEDEIEIDRIRNERE